MSKHNRVRKNLYKLGMTKKQRAAKDLLPATHAEIVEARKRLPATPAKTPVWKRKRFGTIVNTVRPILGEKLK